MAGLSTGAPIVKVYHEKSMILPDVSRVLACLYEKDINFETHTASYKSLLRLQASTNAPVPFYDGPTFLEESREICRYIAETYEHHGYRFLLGKDALERASIEQWLHHEEHTFNPPSRSLFCHLAFPLDDEEDDDIDLQKRKLEEVLEVYEQRLSDSEFLAGNKFTLADLVHLPNSHYITASDKFVYLYDSRKNVQRWWNAISTRGSWQKVLRYIKKVEQQSKLDELEKQKQQQWQKEHPTSVPFHSEKEQISHAALSEPHEGPTPDTHGAVVDKTTEPPLVSQAPSLETGPDSTQPAPASQASLPQPRSTVESRKEESIVAEAEQSKVAADEEKSSLSDQELAHSAQPPLSAKPTKEDTIVAASDQTIAPRTIIGQQDTTPAPDKEKTPFSESDTQHASRTSQETAPEDDHVDESVLRDIKKVEQQSKLDELEKQKQQHEGPTPDTHGAAVDKKTEPPLVSQAPSLETGPDSTPAHGDVHPTSGDEPAIGLLREQEKQPPPASQASLPREALFDSISTQKVSADAFGKEPRSTVESRKEESIVAEAEQSKVAADEEKSSLSDQELAHSAQPPFSAEPTKEDTIVAASGQTIAPRTTEESRNQQQADQAVFKSTQDNEKQVEEIEAQDARTDEPEETNLHENTNQKNNGTSQGEALDQSGKQVSGVQLLNKNTDNGSKSTKNAGIQTDNKSEAPASKTEQPNERDLPANSTRSINSQSQAEASDKSEE